MKKANEDFHKIIDNIHKVIIGKQQPIEWMVVALACNGHVLIEDVPGVGKTTLVSALAKSIDAQFKRIQFTPDVMPSDITGFSMYNPKTHDFEYREGSVLTNVLLADEINRTPPKTQASLLEAMEERQVTVDGMTYKLPIPFIVFATQNPIEYLGTYPLPEAQIDRFLLKISLGYPDAGHEKEILKRFETGNPLATLSSVVSREDVLHIQSEVKKIFLSDALMAYIVELVRETRNHNDLILGASPRASLYLMQAAKAWALYQNRSYVTPDDIVQMYLPIMNHRITLKNEAKYEKITEEQILYAVLEKVSVPTSEV